MEVFKLAPPPFSRAVKLSPLLHFFDVLMTPDALIAVKEGVRIFDSQRMIYGILNRWGRGCAEDVSCRGWSGDVAVLRAMRVTRARLFRR